MQWSIDRPFGPPSLLDRLAGVRDRVRRARAARRYAAHGWTVTQRDDAVLLTTGADLDVIEVPAALATGPVRLGGPVAVTAAGRWLFLVRPGCPLRPELERRLDVVRHGPGSSVPVAPSRLPEGPVRWVVTPAEARWRLPTAEVVQQALVDSLGVVPANRPVVPRQLSTSRRAG